MVEIEMGKTYRTQDERDYRFVGWVKDGSLIIRAGCRDFNIDEAREHWQRTCAGTPLGDETFAILDRIEITARARGLIGKAEAA